jgi:hypothetical protein
MTFNTIKLIEEKSCLFKIIYYLFFEWVIPENIRKLEVNSPTPFGCPNTLTIIRNNFFSPPLPDSRNFLRGGVWISSGMSPNSRFASDTFAELSTIT